MRSRSRVAALSVALALLLASVTFGLAKADKLRHKRDSPQRLNIVLIVSDDQPLGTFEQMPYLSTAGWTTFPNAVVNNPVCCPSRATILTGLNSQRTGIETNADAPKFADAETIGGVLQEEGYETALIGKYLNDYPWERDPNWRPAGWDRWVALRGAASFYDYSLNVDGEIESHGSEPDDHVERVIRRQALDWLGEERQAPFLLTISSHAPHRPALPEPGDERRFRHLDVELPPSVRERDLSDKPRYIRRGKPIAKSKIRAAYRERARSALAVDRTIREVEEQLRRDDLLDETLMIYLSDHGYSLGEHNRFGKKCGYEECIRTPLAIRYPDGTERRIGEPVSNADLAPTIADAAGAELPWAADGESLLPVLRGGPQDRDRAVLLRNAEARGEQSPRPSFWGVRTKNAKYLRLSTGERELYDLRADPYELDNLAGRPEAAELEQAMKLRLRELRG